MASTGQGKKKTAKPAAKKAAESKKDSGGSPATERKTMDWMQDSPNWGTKALPGKKGLTLDAINVGAYGDVPSHSEEMTRMPRGASRVTGIPRLEFYPLSSAVEVRRLG